MKKVSKNHFNRGITLVTLVVTIIVLIILAGVSINLVLGKNGIITMAKRAKENTELAKIEEETALNELYKEIEGEGIGSGGISYDAIAKLVEFKREIASAISDMGVTTAENADADTMSSNIRSISVASSADKVSYDNRNSGLTASNVQGAVDELNNNIETLSADKVSYNNTNSGLTATNMQGAVNELNSSLSTLTWTTASSGLKWAKMPNDLIIAHGVVKISSSSNTTTYVGNGYYGNGSIDITDIPFKTFAYAFGDIQNLAYPQYLFSRFGVNWNRQYLNWYILTDHVNAEWNCSVFIIGM